MARRGAPNRKINEEISLDDIPKILHMLPPREQEKLLAELEKLDELKTVKTAQDKFLGFVKEVWPTFIGGRHHAKMADAFERVANGTCKRLIINMPRAILSPSSPHICSRRGFWANIRRKRSSSARIQPSWPLGSVVKCVTWSIRTLIIAFSRTSHWLLTPRQPVGGTHPRVGTISLSVSGVL